MSERSDPTMHLDTGAERIPGGCERTANHNATVATSTRNPATRCCHGGKLRIDNGGCRSVAADCSRVCRTRDERSHPGANQGDNTIDEGMRYVRVSRSTLSGEKRGTERVPGWAPDTPPNGGIPGGPPGPPRTPGGVHFGGYLITLPVGTKWTPRILAPPGPPQTPPKYPPGYTPPNPPKKSNNLT